MLRNNKLFIRRNQTKLASAQLHRQDLFWCPDKMISNLLLHLFLKETFRIFSNAGNVAQWMAMSVRLLVSLSLFIQTEIPEKTIQMIPVRFCPDIHDLCCYSVKYLNINNVSFSLGPP